jgi:hypothetical protein
MRNDERGMMQKSRRQKPGARSQKDKAEAGNQELE